MQDPEHLPRVWVIRPYRAGEQSQTVALAEALGWPFELKTVHHRWQGALTNLFRGSSLDGIDRERSSPLEAPWPDVVIAAGMRNEPICRWIRAASGGRTRIVHIGRPWANLHNFDLVVATPQYPLPRHPRLLLNTLTLHRATPQRLADALERHGARLDRLPGPRIAVIVGGPSGPYAFGVRAARRLALQASAMARSLGGSLLVTTSARTPPAAVRVLRELIDVPSEFYEWRAEDQNNPYYAYLGVADRLIVSFDSIAMLSEACATRKPVYMFDLRRDRSRPGAPLDEDFGLAALGYRLLVRFGPRRLTRDISLVHDTLLAEGRAAWLGEGDARAGEFESPDVDRAVRRVGEMLDQPS